MQAARVGLMIDSTIALATGTLRVGDVVQTLLGGSAEHPDTSCNSDVIEKNTSNWLYELKQETRRKITRILTYIRSG